MVVAVAYVLEEAAGEEVALLRGGTTKQSALYGARLQCYYHHLLQVYSEEAKDSVHRSVTLLSFAYFVR